MHPVLHRNNYLGMFKAVNNYDVLCPETGEEILHCREPKLGLLTKWSRYGVLTRYEMVDSFNIQISTPSGEPVMRVSRRLSIFPKINVYDENDERIGGLKYRWSRTAEFRVSASDDRILCIPGRLWVSPELRFLAADNELAKASKNWAGLDNFILQISEHVPPDDPVRQLIVAAVMSHNMTFTTGAWRH